MLRPELLITCPKCHKKSNEYNWTLKTAAYFSRGEDTCPTLLQVLVSTLSGSDDFYGYRAMCPRCSQGSDIEEFELPQEERVREYADQMGSAYLEAWL